MTRKQWAACELEISEGSSDEEAKVAYRDLMKVWHPDRHASNERIRKKAEEKCKRLTLAYEVFIGKDVESWIPDGTIEPERASATRGGAGDAASSSPPPVWSETDNPSTSSSSSQSGVGAFGGLVFGGLIGAVFGGWGAIPGAIIGLIIGLLIGAGDRSSGASLDEAGGCALGCLGRLIQDVLAFVVGCGCLLAILVVVVLILSAVR